MNWYAYCAGNPVNAVDPLGLEKVLLRYAIEQAGGTVTWDEKTGTAVATIDGRSVAYKGEIINGRMIVDSNTLAIDFEREPFEFESTINTRFYSMDDAALAFSLIYRELSDKNQKEYGAIIVSEVVGGKKTYSFKNIVSSIPTKGKDPLSDSKRRSLDYDFSLANGETLEATIHTHWHPNGKLDFSETDYYNQPYGSKGMYVVLRTSEVMYSKRTRNGFAKGNVVF